jgi:hypothetical protein
MDIGAKKAEELKMLDELVAAALLFVEAQVLQHFPS